MNKSTQVPADAKGTCRSCKAAILWVKTVRGRKMPLDAEEMIGKDLLLFEVGTDGIARTAEAGNPGHQSHFVTCPDRDAWRAPAVEKAKK